MNRQEQLESLNNLKIMKKLFDEEGIHYWLDAGTLLCAYRDGDLEHEHDTDVGVFVENFSKIKNIEDKLNKLYQNTIGVFILKELYPIYTAWGSGSLPHNVMHGDIIYWYPIKVSLDGNIQNYKYCHGISLPFSLPERLLSNFSTISFKNLDPDNTQFTVPGRNNKEIEEYLEYYFGKDWKIKMSLKEYQQKMTKIINKEIEPYPVNRPIPEVLEFKRKMTNVFYSGKSKIEKIDKIKKYKSNGKVLDFGCNIGSFIELFKENGYDYTGVDNSIIVLNKARNLKPDGNFIYDILWNTSFNEEFDIVHTNKVLQLNTFENQEKILPKIYQALKNDGIFVMTESTFSDEIETQQKQTRAQRTYKEWINFIERYGFKFIESWHKNESGIEDTYLFKKQQIQPKFLEDKNIIKENITKENITKENIIKENITKENLIQLMKHNTPNLEYAKINTKTNIDIMTNLNQIKQIDMNKIDMNKIWNVYLSIAKKSETNGLGNDHADISTFVHIVDSFSKYIPLDKYPKVLDIGCGDGGETKTLKDKGYDVIGITFGIDNIRMAKELYNIDLLEMDMNILNFKPNSFDAIYSVHSFEHVFSPFITCLEMWRVLRTGGRCYISVPNPDTNNSYDGLWHYNLLYTNQIIKMFDMCGFTVIEENDKSNNSFNFIFEKLPTHKISRWNYLKYIHNARNKISENSTERENLCKCSNHSPKFEITIPEHPKINIITETLNTNTNINNDLNSLNTLNTLNTLNFVDIININKYWNLENMIIPFLQCINSWRNLKIGEKCYFDYNNTNLSLDNIEKIKVLFKKSGFKFIICTYTDSKITFEKLGITKIRNWEYLRKVHQVFNNNLKDVIVT